MKRPKLKMNRVHNNDVIATSSTCQSLYHIYSVDPKGAHYIAGTIFYYDGQKWARIDKGIGSTDYQSTNYVKLPGGQTPEKNKWYVSTNLDAFSDDGSDWVLDDVQTHVMENGSEGVVFKY